MISTSAQVKRDLLALADKDRAANLAWFFKTGKGEYGEGDYFLGIPVPVQRKIAARHRSLSRSGITQLLSSRFHEHRFVALAVLVGQFRRGSSAEREEITAFYLSQTERINNWDLVDTSAPYILGEYLKTHKRDLLDQLAHSPNLWERRIAMVSTLALIKSGETEDAFRIAELLLDDKHDLIHKAIGWALRETGVVSRPALLQFLQEHYKQIPCTTLRYAIEHLPPKARKQALSGVFCIK
ncbi:MAG: DNA alkylation repair protein [Acidobacteriaceae bacterium]|nr:DNA alkylation repair protein [Acidobacteriaceae bacterium]